jgi:pyruvate/2-oxoglutarate dehydrogenase complex dihydrolipoamide dehydrogenase (E3) component
LPEPEGAYDLIVIGGGPAGYSAALRISELGGSVVLIEAENPGGNCLNHACLPSRIMLDTAGQALRNQELSFAGVISPAGGLPEFGKAIARKDRLIGQLRLAAGSPQAAARALPGRAWAD